MPPALPDAASVHAAMYEVVGGVLGRARHPGAGRRRRRWAELSRRRGDPVAPEGLPPLSTDTGTVPSDPA
ncbi:hypothetical protein NMG29_32810 [Streptomyces cocklensis]|jgi:hypothetical protein|uniref:Uncharacterized protein n=1 Tax=Actinacidiphila cocklensis TaxID=887465 RepID=A0A9W4DRG8_9ACTN|nr:hypothetical protein [Actinacidiphila cocklensis]MDD1062926.1 hypothetical protein [Actinacidiphila cocklensis]WSX78495.1 hypothetical protein OH826_34390 [Streptomyces sp. NBC_00899]CAG6394888.1 hypothetical protein SCOCK_30121 [Actinacidiphila cocklensis]